MFVSFDGVMRCCRCYTCTKIRHKIFPPVKGLLLVVAAFLLLQASAAAPFSKSKTVSISNWESDKRAKRSCQCRVFKFPSLLLSYYSSLRLVWTFSRSFSPWILSVPLCLSIISNDSPRCGSFPWLQNFRPKKSVLSKDLSPLLENGKKIIVGIFEPKNLLMNRVENFQAPATMHQSLTTDTNGEQ